MQLGDTTQPERAADRGAREVVVAGWWSELLHPALPPKVACCVIVPIPSSVLLYNKQWRH